MNKKRKPKFQILFTVLVLLTILVCLPIFINSVSEKDDTPYVPDTEQTNSDKDQMQQKPEEIPEEPPEDKVENPPEGTDEAPSENSPDAQLPEEEPPQEEPETSGITLFIGDSRTVGIMEYAGLENSEFFCSVGMNVYKLFDETVNMPEHGSIRLESLLNEVKYKRIHIMLGINELGCDFTTTVNKYQDTVNRIRELQPNAVLYIGANLHVSSARSDSDSVFNNGNINRFNQLISEIADGTNVKYLDSNVVFDENGALPASNTSDGIHVYASCYKTWGQWLYEAMDMNEEN